MPSREDHKTVLVLDDDPQFHRLIEPVLTSRGHRVLSAQTGREATYLLQRNRVDLAIVDGQLPDTTGIEWIAQLRASGHQAVLMFVSAYWRDAQSYHKLTKELGVALVLHKPVLAPVFAAEVDILLGHAGDEPSLSDFEDTLLALRAEYARELPARMDELARLVQQLRAEPHNLFIGREAATLAHKLRGTAASYGFPEIGAIAAELEESLVALQNVTDERRGDQLMAGICGCINQAVVLAHAAATQTQLSDRIMTERLAAISELSAGSAIAKILVVDDDAAFLDLLDELSRQHQIEIVRASGPSEALDMACMAEVDAALIDVDLGSHDTAFKLALELRQLPGYAYLPLAFLSGTGHIERMIEVDNVGQCLYIEKPLRSDALQIAIEQLIAIRQASRPKVLLIDDDIEFAKRTAFVLTHEGMHVRRLDTTVNILDDMHDFNPDVVLLDVMMPGVSGFDICRMLRTIPRWRDLPIIFLTGYNDIDTRVACMRCGGDDYLSKPVVNEELFTRLRMRLEHARLLRNRIDRDNVTGLLLRRAFMEKLAAMISEARRHEWTVTVCLVRVDSPVAGPNGSTVSDTVHNAIGALLGKRLRPEDLKGRWSQDALILAFRNEPEVVVKSLLDRVLSELSAMCFTDQYGSELKPRVTCGMAQLPADGVSIHELLEAADRNLNQSPMRFVNKSVGTG